MPPSRESQVIGIRLGQGDQAPVLDLGKGAASPLEGFSLAGGLWRVFRFGPRIGGCQGVHRQPAHPPSHHDVPRGVPSVVKGARDGMGRGLCLGLRGRACPKGAVSAKRGDALVKRGLPWRPWCTTSPVPQGGWFSGKCLVARNFRVDGCFRVPGETTPLALGARGGAWYQGGRGSGDPSLRRNHPVGVIWSDAGRSRWDVDSEFPERQRLWRWAFVAATLVPGVAPLG